MHKHKATRIRIDHRFNPRGRAKLTRVIIGLIFWAGVGCGVALYPHVQAHKDSPTPANAENLVATPSAKIKVKKQEWEGTASFYSRAGCIGCSKTLTMANGKPLDDEGLTVAFNKLPLGRMVRITNVKYQMFVDAKVTDRGGFERLGRIVDMTTAVKDAISCSHLCQVTIEEL